MTDYTLNDIEASYGSALESTNSNTFILKARTTNVWVNVTSCVHAANVWKVTTNVTVTGSLAGLPIHVECNNIKIKDGRGYTVTLNFIHDDCKTGLPQ